MVPLYTRLTEVTKSRQSLPKIGFRHKVLVYHLQKIQVSLVSFDEKLSKVLTQHSYGTQDEAKS